MPKPRPLKPVIALGTTAVGLAVVLGLHPHGSTAVLAGASAGPASAGSGRAPQTTTTSTSRPPAVASQSGPTTAASSGPRSATGKLEQYGYGDLAVRVTVNGTRITNVVVAKLQVAEPTSGQYAAQADPMLCSQALSMQTWQIDGVSGATYTSEAFAYSLQSALNQLHFA
ncbi:MAG TPA: FMN-binding protein [Acidimicrobiales bacterium]|nr:FMN-binding protein [Acidimicrobiales bacterium]